ncbi:MAG TPA: AraC family transcriptional regulator ligand-binding domain-containing protein [Hymenobacter sp.]|nr:AraC family transcriptional regulator ligand-binding domain-containing protein [Hymenobacter sp.]
MRLATPLLHSLLACLQKMGLSPGELLAPDGLVEADLAAAQQGISTRAMTTLWRNAAHQILDPQLPFRVGGQLYVEQLGILGYILRNCEHLGAALGKLEKYNRLTNDFVDFRHKATGRVVEISFCFSARAPAGSFLRRVFTLLELGVLTSGLAQLIHRPIVPVYVQCELDEEDRRYLQANLGCPVEESTNTNLLVFDRELLQAPILLPDQVRRQQLEHLADAELVKMGRQQSWADRVRRMIGETLDGEKPAIERVAAAFSITARALQRRLQEEDTSFQALSEEVRKELALRYLQQSYSVNEVAYLLGYSVPSAFSRAFKSWTGYTPLEFKQRENLRL